ncbi:uncharacterized protein [Maniola hyperantus]|uniref:uncharacterized protein n=1 Tax=Aphantopus hyperantus TaxID=2795564 RepID=UPI003748F62D
MNQSNPGIQIWNIEPQCLCNPVNPILFNVPAAPTPVWDVPPPIYVTPTYTQPNVEHLHGMSNMPTALQYFGIPQKQPGQAHHKFRINPQRPKKGRFKTITNKKEDLRFYLLKKRADKIKKKECHVRANEAASKNNKYKQDAINPLSISIQRKHYHNYGVQKQGGNTPHPSDTRNRKSFSANQAAKQRYTERDTNKSYVNAPASLSRSPKPNEENMCLEENLNSQGDINPLERNPKILQVKESVTFIVPDSNVFLNNIDLLRDILNTDKIYHLLLPRMVMNKIETATGTHSATVAYKALYFIHEQSDADRATIEEENEDTESSDDNILNFCCQLMDQKSLVLLTDDTEIINNANTNNSINIHIITTAKMKQLVNVGKSNKIITSNYKSNETTTRNVDSREFADVKITIDNKSNIQCDEKFSKSPVRKCLNPEKGLDENKVENQIYAKDVSQNDKKACDIGMECRNSNQRENVTIEETSNSVISNMTNNVDTEGERAGVHKANNEADDWIVMFEVTDRQMEEALRVKADEWVTRFVQIMEEALSQLQQREQDRAPCLQGGMPNALREAVQCVRRRFRHEADVVRAADCLLAFSKDNGGLRGNIKSNLTPHKYMELYSYGVYLIDALEGILSSDEDLQMAAKALSKLLDDIQQSHPGDQDDFSDVSAQDAFHKYVSRAKVNPGGKLTAIKIRRQIKESARKDKKKQSRASTPGKYNLRSQRKRKIEENNNDDDPNANCEKETVPFKLYLESLNSDITKDYSSIHDFIERSRESLQSEDTSVDDIRRMQARAQTAMTDISNICDQFRSILSRESTDQSNLFQNIKIKEYENIIVENGDMESYRALISKCLEDGRNLKTAVEWVLAACVLKLKAA